MSFLVNSKKEKIYIGKCTKQKPQNKKNSALALRENFNYDFY